MSQAHQPKTAFDINQFDYCYPPGIEAQYWQIARNKKLKNRLSRLLQQPDDLVLEIGCGRGIVVEYMRNAGIDCYGVELADDVPIPDVLKNYISAGIDANDLPEDFRKKVKIIMLLDVIEHLPEPTELLSRLQQNFPNLKYFLITVPACKELWSNYDEFYGHFRRYDLVMLNQQAQQIGLEAQQLHYFFKMLYLPARLLLTMGKKRNVKLSGPKSGLGKWIHQIVALGSLLLDTILPASWKGSSCFVVFSKK